MGPPQRLETTTMPSKVAQGTQAPPHPNWGHSWWQGAAESWQEDAGPLFELLMEVMTPPEYALCGDTVPDIAVSREYLHFLNLVHESTVTRADKTGVFGEDASTGDVGSEIHAQL